MCFNSVVKWDTPKLELQIGWMKWAHVTTIVLYRKIFENILSENFSWRSWVFWKTLLSWEITHDKQSSIHVLYCVSKQFKDSMGRLYKRSYSRGCGISCEVEHGEHSMICPRCNKYISHLEYIKEGFKARGILEPNFELQNWGCPQCIYWHGFSIYLIDQNRRIKL